MTIVSRANCGKFIGILPRLEDRSSAYTSFRVLNTTDDAAKRRKNRARLGGRFISSGNRRAVGKIYEIEIYGYKPTKESSKKKEIDQREQELDELLK